MKITALKQQIKDNNRVSVFVDGNYSFSLTLDQLISEKLRNNMEITDEQVEALKKKSLDTKLRLKVIEWLSIRPRSEKELRDYLKKRKIDENHALNLVSELKDNKYFSDEKFAEWLIEYKVRKLKSSLEIRHQLRQKGINDNTISKVLNDYKDDEMKNLRKLILKYQNKYNDENKLIAYLTRRGYSFSAVKEALAEV